MVEMVCVNTMQCHLWQWSRSTFTYLHQSCAKTWWKTLPRSLTKGASVFKETLPRLVTLWQYKIKCVVYSPFFSLFSSPKDKKFEFFLFLFLFLFLPLCFSVDGGWSDWSKWTSCSKSCGTGFRERSRSCTRPAPSFGGKSCPGEARKTHKCNTHSCPGTKMDF